MPTPPTAIASAPPVPDSTDPNTVFDAEFEAFNLYLKDQFRPGVNALANNVFDNAVEAAASAAAASSNGAAAVALANAAATAAATSASTASGHASAAAASAATAVNAPATTATSTTSLLIGTGAKSLVIQPGKAFVVGHWLVIGSATASMVARVLAHNSSTGALDVTVSSFTGTGTESAWNVAISGPAAAGGGAADDSLMFFFAGA